MPKQSDFSSLPAPAFRLACLDPEKEVMFVYEDQFPPELGLAHDCERLVSNAKAGAANFNALWRFPLGAPVGPYLQTSERVARLCGVSLNPEALTDEVEVQNIILAQSYVRAGWEATVDGTFLVLDFFAPQCEGLGSRTSPLAEAQMSAHLVKQQEAQALSLLHHVHNLTRADALLVRYRGVWDEAYDVLRGRLTKCLVTAFMAQRMACLANEA